MLTSVSVFVELVVIVFCDLIDERTSAPLFKDVVQPVELDLVLEARVVHLAVGLAALHQANQAFRLRAGRLLVEVVPQTDWAAMSEATTGDLPHARRYRPSLART